MANGFNASGRMSVGRFEKEFEEAFGIKCQIKEGRKFADDSARLASLRPDDFEGPKTVDFTVNDNMLVKNLKSKFESSFGGNIQLYYKNRVAPDEITLGALKRGDFNFGNDIEETSDTTNEDVEVTDTAKENTETADVTQEDIREADVKMSISKKIIAWFQRL